MSRPSQLLAAAAVAAVLLAQPLRAADDAVTLNFVNADIDAVIRAVGEMTGRNFVLDPRVKGVVNIVSATPVPRALIYPTLLSALRLQGLAAIEGPGVTKIVPEAEAKQQGMPVVTGPVTVGGDRLVTAVYMLKYESATQLVNVLRPLITPNNAIAAVPTANALVITDYAENLKRIDRIIASLDVAPAGEPIVVPLRNASALDIVPMLTRLLADTAPGAGAVADAQQRLTLVADARSNSVLIRGENAARLARVRALIGELDTAGRAGGNISIIYLKNADAVRVARTLRALFSGGGDAGEATPAASLAPNAGGLAAGGMTTATAASAGATATVTAAPAGGTAAGFAASGVTIQADA
ncbi:MAG: secretin N-terminal domain-containing protein, partial [Betaproteobacteria bacterium]